MSDEDVADLEPVRVPQRWLRRRKTTFNAALVTYRNGVGSISEVTTAERQLLEAKNAATDAYSTALSAAATLALPASRARPL
jgi:outer membrane protein TolC